MTIQQDLMALAQRWQDEAAASWGETKEHATLQRCCDELREAAAQLDGIAADRDSWRQRAEDRVRDWDGMRQRSERAEAQLGRAGVPEYDRELIAEMLTDERSMPVSSYSREAINEQVSLLRAADNRDAEGVHTAKREEAVTDGFVLVPRELAERVDSALGRFCGDEGWTADDMGTMDDFGAVIAAAPQPDSEESR